MEHDPDVMRVCALEYLEDVKEHREKLQWSKENLAMAKESMDSIKATNLGYEPAFRKEMSKVQKAYEDLVRAREEYGAQLAESFGFLAEAHKVCNREDLPTWVCWLHWVDGMKWPEVAKHTAYSLSHLKTWVVPRGLERIYSKMPEDYRRDTIPNAQPGKGFVEGSAKDKTESDD